MAHQYDWHTTIQWLDLTIYDYVFYQTDVHSFSLFCQNSSSGNLHLFFEYSNMDLMDIVNAETWF